MQKIVTIFIIAISLYACTELLTVENIENERVDILAPVENAVLSDTIVNFSWNEVAHADTYRLQVFYPNIENATEVKIDTLMENTLFQLLLSGNSEDSTQYQWRVRAENSAYSTAYSVASFSIKLESVESFDQNVVVLVSPEDNLSTNQATQNLSWESVPEATEYRVQVWEPDIEGSLIADFNASETNIDYTFPDGDFLWQVKAVKDAESTAYTARNIIVAATAPNTPILLTPEDASNVPLGNVSFTWERTPIQGSVEKDSLYIFRDKNLIDLYSKEEVSNEAHIKNISTDAIYYWRMKSFNEAGNESAFSETFSFTAGTPFNQETVILLAPEDNLSTNESTQNLSWESLSEATEYRIQIWQPDTSGTLISDLNTSDTNINYTFPDGDFLWQVKAINATESTAFSGRNITIEATPPNTPVLLTPANYSNQTPGLIFFTWDRAPISGSDEYDFLYIYTDENLTQLFSEEQVYNGQHIKDITTVGTYYWRMKAFDDAGNESEYSETFNFSTDTPFSEETVVLLAPEDNLYTNQATQNLSWESLSEATEYRVQIWQPDTSGTLVSDLNTSDTNINYTFPDGDFVWQVKALNATESTAYSARNITVEATPPNTHILLTPENNSTQTSGPITFTWDRTPIAGSDEYDVLYIYTDEELTQLFSEEQVNNGQHIKDIPAVGTYYWRMKAFDEAGNESEYSETFNFLIE